MSSSFRLNKSGLEVYTTEEVEEEEEEKTPSKKKDEEEEEEEDETVETDTVTNFKLCKGEINHIDYIGDIYSDSYEEDYSDISSNASISVPITYLNYMFKGRRAALRKGWQEDDNYTWEKMSTSVTGFITEITWNNVKVDLRISGMDKLMDETKQFNFEQQKRSEIVKQIIESVGLKAKVDVTGLEDDICDFTNESSSGDDEDSEGGYSGEVSDDIAKAAKQICKGKKTCLEKAKAIWKWCHDNMTYQGYSNSQKGAEICFKERSGNCCDHANVVVQMLKAVNVKCAYEHSGSCYGTGHVWAVADCGGKTYRIDASVKSRGFDQVGNGCTGTRKESLGF